MGTLNYTVCNIWQSEICISYIVFIHKSELKVSLKKTNLDEQMTHKNEKKFSENIKNHSETIFHDVLILRLSWKGIFRGILILRVSDHNCESAKISCRENYMPESKRNLFLLSDCGCLTKIVFVYAGKNFYALIGEVLDKKLVKDLLHCISTVTCMMPNIYESIRCFKASTVSGQLAMTKFKSLKASTGT